MKRRLHDNLRRIRDRIANACLRADRSPEEVTMVAVTKSVGVDVIRQLLELDCCVLGESRVQELSQRAAIISEQHKRLRDAGQEPPEPQWHLVGHLQRNKVKAVLPWVTCIQSLDSLRLAEDLDRWARKLDRKVDVLLQVNAAGEAQKSGIAVGAVNHLVEQIVSLPGLRVCGLMAMAPLEADADALAWVFGRVREIFVDLCHEPFVGREFRHLSMGMSNDFEMAVEHGATMVRIGSALFDGVAGG